MGYLSIRALRTLVTQKQAYKELLGPKEFAKLYSRYKQGTKTIPSITSLGKDIELVDVNFKNTVRGRAVSLFAESEELGVRARNITFYGDEINLENIIKRINDYERRTIALKNVPRSLDELKPKSLKKLFSSKFVPKRRTDELGRPVTTIIDRQTQEPVEVYVKHLTNPAKPNSLETYEIYIKNPKGEDELIGFREIRFDIENKTLIPGNMESFANDRYEGIGTRLHQLGIERTMQKGYGAVVINSTDSAFPFHYKSLFRMQPTPERNFGSDILPAIKKEVLDIAKGKTTISPTELDNCFIRTRDGKLFDMAKTKENIQKLFFQKRLSDSNGVFSRMILDGENLEYWKCLIAKQPITLG